MPEPGSEAVVSPVARTSPHIDALLMPSKDKSPDGKFYVDGSLPKKRYEIKPTNDWNEIHKWDSAHQIKVKVSEAERRATGQATKDIPLSDFMLQNVKGLVELAWSKKFITEEDLHKKIPFMYEKDGKLLQYQDPKEGPVFEKPYEYLVKSMSAGELKLPKNLTAEQTQDLLLLVFDKTVNTVDYKDRRNQEGLSDVFIEDVAAVYENLADAGTIDKTVQTPTSKFTPVPLMQALNIACRKAVEKNLEEKAYSLRQDYVREGETAEERVKNRLKIGAGVLDQSEGDSARKEIKELMDVHEKETGKMESSVQLDLLVAQAFDVLVPAKERLQMLKDEMNIESISDYKDKALEMAKLDKKKQMWRMAILRHFNLERRLPGTTIPSIAEEINNQRIFKAQEAKMIDGQYTQDIAKQIAGIDSAQKDEGGFNALNLSSANLLKAEQLLDQVLPDPDAGTGKQRKDAKTIKLEKAANINKRLTKLLNHSQEFYGHHTPEESQEQLAIKRKDYIKKTGLLVGLSNENRALVERILEDAFRTQVSIERRLVNMSVKEKGSIKPESVDFASNIEMGIKGVDLLYRRGVTEIIPEGERYDSKNMRGEPNYKVIRDKYDVPHIGSTKGRVDLPVGEAQSSMSQVSEDEKQSKRAEEEKSEELARKQEERKRNTAELGRILGLEGGTADEKDLLKKLDKKGYVQVEKNGEWHIEIDQIDVDNISDLNTLASLSDLVENTRIEIKSLRLHTTEKGDLKAETPLSKFNIDKLSLSGELGDKDSVELRLLGTSVKELVIDQGVFLVYTDHELRTVSMDNKNGKEKILDVIYTNEAALKAAMEVGPDKGTTYKLGENASVIIDTELPGQELNTLYSDIDEGDIANGRKWNTRKTPTGQFILVEENEVYSLKTLPTEDKKETKKPEAGDLRAARSKAITLTTQALKELNAVEEGHEAKTADDLVRVLGEQMNDYDRKPFDNAEANEFFHQENVGSYILDLSELAFDGKPEALIAVADYIIANAESRPDDQRRKDMSTHLARRILTQLAESRISPTHDPIDIEVRKQLTDTIVKLSAVGGEEPEDHHTYLDDPQKVVTGMVTLLRDSGGQETVIEADLVDVINNNDEAQSFLRIAKDSKSVYENTIFYISKVLVEDSGRYEIRNVNGPDETEKLQIVKKNKLPEEVEAEEAAPEPQPPSEADLIRQRLAAMRENAQRINPQPVAESSSQTAEETLIASLNKPGKLKAFTGKVSSTFKSGAAAAGKLISRVQASAKSKRKLRSTNVVSTVIGAEGPDNRLQAVLDQLDEKGKTEEPVVQPEVKSDDDLHRFEQTVPQQQLRQVRPRGETVISPASGGKAIPAENNDDLDIPTFLREARSRNRR